MTITLPRLACTALAAWLCGAVPGHARGQEMDNQIFHWSQVDVDAARFDGTSFGRWEGSGWMGRDFDRLWWSTEGDATDAGVGSAEVMALYGHYFRRFWDVVVGYRQDIDPTAQGHLTVGVMGLAPYWFDVAAFAFLSHRGEPSMRLEADTDLLLTQRLILTLGGEIDWLFTDDERVGLDAGISDVELGLRTRYEIRRKLAPYVDLLWVREQEAVPGAPGPLTESGFQIGAGLRLIH